MKTIVFVLLNCLLFLPIFAQNKSTKGSKYLQTSKTFDDTYNGTRIPEDENLDFITLEIGGVVGPKSFTGAAFSLNYEHRFLQSNWAIYTTATYTVASRDLENTYSATDSTEHLYGYNLGVGFHYYIFNYHNKLKPYVGLGIMTGLNEFETYIEDGRIQVTDSGAFIQRQWSARRAVLHSPMSIVPWMASDLVSHDRYLPPGVEPSQAAVFASAGSPVSSPRPLKLRNGRASMS